MKKFILIYIMLSCIFAVSCGNTVENKKYKSYVCNMANDGIISKFEKDWWTGKSVFDVSVEERKAFLFKSDIYSAEYTFSRWAKNGPTRIDYFYDKNQGATLKFESSTGKFAGIHFDSLLTDEYISKQDKDNSYEYALDMAKRIATEYIDIDKYKFEHSQMTVPGVNENFEVILYMFEFTKYINDFKTSERVYINITSKGDLFTLNVSNIGLFDATHNIKIDKAALDDSVKLKLKDLYEDEYQYKYKIFGQTLTYSPENVLTVISAIEVELMTNESDVFHTGLELATVIE